MYKVPRHGEAFLRAKRLINFRLGTSWPAHLITSFANKSRRIVTHPPFVSSVDQTVKVLGDKNRYFPSS